MQEISQDQLVHKRESIYFILVVLFSVLLYVTLAITVIGIFVLLALIIISALLHGIMMGGIRRNGVKIGENQFPELYEKAVTTAKDMGFSKIPDIYVVESEGVLNAFATRFFGKNMVVLYSGIFELIEKEAEKEVLFVLAHEFAHLKRKHVLISTFILPAMWVPFLGNAYLRACEYTCDRYAAFYVQSFEASKNALTMLAVGKELYPKVNKQVYMEQLQTESGFFVWFNEKLSTHPHLPKRIYALANFFAADTTAELKEPKGRVYIGIAAFIVSFSIVFAGSILFFNKMKDLPIWSETSWVEEDQEITELMNAASENDIETIAALLGEGDNLEDVDIDGFTALHWAVLYNQYESALILLEAGANPNAIDNYGSSPLITAVNNDDAQMVHLLIEYGADMEFIDSYGLTAYDYAVDYQYDSIIQLLDGY